MEITDLREMVELDPDDALMRYVLATRLLEDHASGSLEEAVEHLEFVVEKDPQHVASYLALGQAYLRQGRDDVARDCLENGKQIAGELQHGEGLDLVPQFEELLESL